MKFTWAHLSSLSRSLWMASLTSYHINRTTQLGVVHKLAEVAPNLCKSMFLIKILNITSPIMEHTGENPTKGHH